MYVFLAFISLVSLNLFGLSGESAVSKFCDEWTRIVGPKNSQFDSYALSVQCSPGSSSVWARASKPTRIDPNRNKYDLSSCESSVHINETWMQAKQESIRHTYPGYLPMSFYKYDFVAREHQVELRSNVSSFEADFNATGDENIRNSWSKLSENRSGAKSKVTFSVAKIEKGFLIKANAAHFSVQCQWLNEKPFKRCNVIGSNANLPKSQGAPICVKF